MRLIVIPFYKYRKGASLEERMEVYARWKRDMARLNPSHFHPDGQRRGFMGTLRNWVGRRESKKGRG